tara:strand:+ start:226 stop:408 length:183 start_codon:yes stop_codon:yes gene_type:complete
MGRNMNERVFRDIATCLVKLVATGQLPRERAANQLYMAFQQCKGVNYLTYDSFEEAIQNV